LGGLFLVDADLWYPAHRALYGVNPDAIQGRVALNGRGQPLRDVSDALFDRGYATPLGKPYSASAVQSMLG
jgi:hypothetical protein